MEDENKGQEQIIDRNPPEPVEQRAGLVDYWKERVLSAKKYWGPSYKQMREDQDFAYGYQWSKDKTDNRYVANTILRTIGQKQAMVYAKNPKAVAHVRERMEGTLWDETQTELKGIRAAIEMAQQQSMQTGDPSATEAVLQQVMPIIQDAVGVQERKQMYRKMGKTLELVYAYNVNEQIVPFKQRFKSAIKAALTTGVSYLKLGYQRVMEPSLDTQAKIADIQEQLQMMQQLATDLSDGEFEVTDPRAERLRLLEQALQNKEEIIVREGLTFDFPSAFQIIPDAKCTNLKGFVGCDWVAQEHLLTIDQVQQIYGVDVSSSFVAYTADRAMRDGTVENEVRDILSDKINADNPDSAKLKVGLAVVWEIYCKTDGLVYHVCDGHKNFLREPAEPEIKLERFWPWFAFCPNEVDHVKEVFPPSDVRLMKDMQQEINRARQGLREHRIAARPKTIVPAGMLSQGDKQKLEDHPANAVIELLALQPGQSVNDLLQPWSGPQVNPVMYEVNPFYEDVLRVSGMQEANLGGTSGSTATESQIAQSSLSTSIGSTIDEIDDMLTEVARESGHILLREMDAQTVKDIVGPGAVWPEFTNEEIIQDIFLEVEAGSTGRPNQTAEIANFERIAPLLMQLPGMNPEFLAREGLRRLDDRMDLTNAFMPEMPSINMMNSSGPGAEGAAGQAQGGQGAANAQRPPESETPQGAPQPQQVEAQSRGLPN